MECARPCWPRDRRVSKTAGFLARRRFLRCGGLGKSLRREAAGAVSRACCVNLLHTTRVGGPSVHHPENRGNMPIGWGHRVDRAQCGTSNDTAYLQRRADILQACGEICRTERLLRNSAPFGCVRKPVNCNALWSTTVDTARPITRVPRDVPCSMWDDYSMGGQANVTGSYTRTLKAAKAVVFRNSTLSAMKLKAEQHMMRGTYSALVSNSLLDALDATRHLDVRGKRVLVIGTEIPWVEVALIVSGAAHVTTLEYGKLVSEHPQISTATPASIRESFLRGGIVPFDAVVTFSSVEHSGLGRYGDPLNPWGDLLAIARAWCITREGGHLLIGVPFEGKGRDRVIWNVHRVYGPSRYPHLAANWKLVEQLPAVGGTHESLKSSWQRLHLFRRLPPSESVRECYH